MTKTPQHHELAQASHHATAGASRQLAVLQAGTGTLAVPKPPTGLKAKGKQAWTCIWQDAGPWLTPMDAPGVELVCRLFDEANGYDAVLKREGMFFQRPIVTPRGDVVGHEPYPHPATDAKRKLETSVARLVAEYALSPQSRAKLGLVQVQAQSKLEELLRSRRQTAPQEVTLD